MDLSLSHINIHTMTCRSHCSFIVRYWASITFFPHLLTMRHARSNLVTQQAGRGNRIDKG
jgi:hypothetical protein